MRRQHAGAPAAHASHLGGFPGGRAILLAARVVRCCGRGRQYALVLGEALGGRRGVAAADLDEELAHPPRVGLELAPLGLAAVAAVAAARLPGDRTAALERSRKPQQVHLRLCLGSRLPLLRILMRRFLLVEC